MTMLPPIATIIFVATLISFVSASPMRRGGPQVPFVPRQHQDRSVFFEVSKHQRDVLSGKRECTQEEFDKVFDHISCKIRKAYHEEGYVIIRGLLDEELIERLSQGGNTMVDHTKLGKTFASMEFGPVFLAPPNCSQETNDESCDHRLASFREASMASAIPSFIAKILFEFNEESGKTLRVLKDVFLAKGKEGSFCGWHVDDFSFWPTSTRATADMPGVNAWIAMDDISPTLGGGLAVCPRSHKADWKEEAYKIIGSPTLYPEEGFENAEDLFASGQTTTCSMAKAQPEFAKRIDEAMHVFDFKRGDVLFHTRWLFHRSMPITSEGYRHFEKLGKDPMFMRYSIRYEVGEARLLRGFSVEASALLTPDNKGKTLDLICATDAPWYPKCWPKIDESEMSQLYSLVNEKMPAAKALVRKQMESLLPVYQKKS